VFLFGKWLATRNDLHFTTACNHLNRCPSSTACRRDQLERLKNRSFVQGHKIENKLDKIRGRMSMSTVWGKTDVPIISCYVV